MGKVKDLTNQKFGRLTAIKPTVIDKGNMLWLCHCDCGGEITVRSNSLITGKVKSCGCLRTESAQKAGKGKKEDLTGQQFNDLTVLKDSGQRDKYKAIVWDCQCSCGNMTPVRGNDLKSGNIKSCGCKRSEEQSKSGKKHIDALFETMVENTNLAILNTKLGKANKSGIKGVHWNKAVQKWEAILTFQGQRHKLGQYDKIQDAAKARALAEEKYFDPILKKYGRETTE